MYDTAGSEWGKRHPPVKPPERADAGWVVCKRCYHATHAEDLSRVFSRTCDTCATKRLDRIVERAVRRVGRHAAVRLLKRLGR